MASYRVKVTGGYLQLTKAGKPGGGDGNGDGNGNGDGDGDLGTVTPEIPDQLPDPPPGLWPAPTPSNPIVALSPEQAQTLPPGGIWPRPQGDKIPGTFCALVSIPEHGWHFVIIDPDAIAMPQIPRPTPTAPGR